MSWKLRHQGSPQTIDGLTAQQVVEGLQEGLWEPDDEVLGPGDADWRPIEEHPQYEEIAVDLEPRVAQRHDPDSNLDMNPLIDVCLVLLIFFMMTTTYAALQRMLDMPGIERKDVKGPPKVTKEQVARTLILVRVGMNGGKPAFRIEDKDVTPEGLEASLSTFVKGTGKKEILLDAAPDVEWEWIVKVQDAAQGAKINKVHFLTKKGEG